MRLGLPLMRAALVAALVVGAPTAGDGAAPKRVQITGEIMDT